MTKRLTFIVLACIIGVSAYSQKTIQEWLEMEDKKIHKKWAFTNHMGYIKSHIESTDDPLKIENIAMLSYVMFSPNPDLRSDQLIRPMQITDAGTEYLVDNVYSYALPGLTKGFEGNGIKFMTNPELQSIPGKQEVYNNREFDMSKMVKAAVKAANFFSNRDTRGDAKGTPEGHKYLVETILDAKLWREIGAFAGEMGVDAVLCVKQTIYWDGKKIFLGRIEMNIMGPNPIPENPDHYYTPAGPIKGYLKGLSYASVVLDPPKPYEIGNMKKKNTTFNMEGLDLVYERVANILIGYMNSEIANLYQK